MLFRTRLTTSTTQKRLKLILNECCVSADCAGTVVVLKTLPGLADAAGAALDAMRLPDMLGCISGNDFGRRYRPQRAGRKPSLRGAAPVLQK